jgi:hypothetical protein
MVHFKTKNPNLGKFWRALEWKTLVYFMANRNILRPFGIIYVRLVKFMVIWYVIHNLVCWDQEKSGNPGWQLHSGGLAPDTFFCQPDFFSCMTSELFGNLVLKIINLVR